MIHHLKNCKYPSPFFLGVTFEYINHPLDGVIVDKKNSIPANHNTVIREDKKKGDVLHVSAPRFLSHQKVIIIKE